MQIIAIIIIIMAIRWVSLFFLSSDVTKKKKTLTVKRLLPYVT